MTLELSNFLDTPIESIGQSLDVGTKKVESQ